MSWDPSAYGEAFADVYDDWYGARDDAPWVVAAVAAITPSGAGGDLLELGVGTGRLAVPLAAAGWRVTGLDASAQMLRRLAAKDTPVVGVLGDAAMRADYPDGPFDLIVAAYNFVFNLPDRAAQAACLAAAAAVSAPEGILVLEAFVPDSAPPAGSIESAGPVDGVRIVTEADPVTGVIHGEHRHPDGRIRRWRVCPVGPNELDAMAAAAGWTLLQRWETWDGVPFEPTESGNHVSAYRRARLPVTGSPS